MTLVRLAKEEEGVGVAMGAHLAGVRSALLMQNHGFLQAINGIVSGAMLYRVPLLMVISDRGHLGERDPWQTEGGRYTRRVLDALGIVHDDLREPGDTPVRVDRAMTLAPRLALAGGPPADPLADVGRATCEAPRVPAGDLRGHPGLRRRHDHGRHVGRAALAGPPAELLLPDALDGPRLLGRAGPRPLPAGPARGRAGRRRLGADEPGRPHHAGPIRPAQPGGDRGRHESLLSVGGFPTATRNGDRPGGLRAWRRDRGRRHRDHHRRLRRRGARRPGGERLACVVAKVEAVGPPATAYDVDTHMLEYRFMFARAMRQPPAAGGKMP